jgi:hypothetical protein
MLGLQAEIMNLIRETFGTLAMTPWKFARCPPGSNAYA